MVDAQRTELTLQRLQTKLQARFASLVAERPMQWDIFITRLREHFPPLLERLVHLYGTRIDFFYHLEELGAILADAWFTRPVVLKKLDADRERDPLWFQSNRMLGGVCYVDLFATDLQGLSEKI